MRWSPTDGSRISVREGGLMRIAAWLCVFCLAVASVVCCAQEGENKEPAPAAQKFVVIRAGTLIDGKSDTPRQNQVIVIRGNRIDSVGDAASTRTPAGATVIDLSRATVLPGLIDSHTHIFL